MTAADGSTPAFSWNNSNYSYPTINFTTLRALDIAASPYVYTEWAGSPYSLTLNTDIDGVATSLSINAGGDTYAVPIAGLLLSMPSGELCRIRSVSGTSSPYTVTVERGSSGTIPAVQSAGTISCLNRISITSLAQLGTQVFEVVTQAKHNLKSGIFSTFGGTGTYPTMYFTNGSSYNASNSGYAVMVTGPTTYVVNTRGPVGTIGPSTAYPAAPTSYALSPPSAYNCTITMPSSGFPPEVPAIVTGSFDRCNLQVNIPCNASDSYCYNVATRILNNFPAGRKVYVELGDEFWNGGQSEIYFAQVIQKLCGYSDIYKWVVIRTGQIRTIFRTVFGARASEIKAVFGGWFNDPSTGADALNLAIANGVTIDAYGVAPYIDPENNAASIAAWNNSATIQQMIDLWIHDLYYNKNGYSAFVASHQANIASYNAATGGSCVLYGYEGGYETGVPSGANQVTKLTRDIAYDPNWRIIEQDMYALFQQSGFADLNLYSYSIYYVPPNNWGLYHSPYQQPGRGDGSDGKANNRLCLATPGYTHSKAATTNQDQQNVSVRGQAFLEWMQPAQAKKRMLFVPYRFVNR